MGAWGFNYVENLTWVWTDAANRTLALPSPLARRSHGTLMIYRRGAEEVQLRHQRSPDVVFGCVTAAGPGQARRRGGGGGGGVATKKGRLVVVG